VLLAQRVVLEQTGLLVLSELLEPGAAEKKKKKMMCVLTAAAAFLRPL
jgi:hypothetical protein